MSCTCHELHAVNGLGLFGVELIWDEDCPIHRPPWRTRLRLWLERKTPSR